MEEIDLNWIFYEDIEEVIDEKIDNENVTVDNVHEIQENIGVSNNELNHFNTLITFSLYI